MRKGKLVYREEPSAGLASNKVYAVFPCDIPCDECPLRFRCFTMRAGPVKVNKDELKKLLFRGI